MDQETFNGIVRVLQRGAGVMANDYIAAFTTVVAELQTRIRAEQEALAKQAQAQDENTAKAETSDTESKGE